MKSASKFPATCFKYVCQFAALVCVAEKSQIGRCLEVNIHKGFAAYHATCRCAVYRKCVFVLGLEIFEEFISALTRHNFSTSNLLQQLVLRMSMFHRVEKQDKRFLGRHFDAIPTPLKEPSRNDFHSRSVWFCVKYLLARVCKLEARISFKVYSTFRMHRRRKAAQCRG